MSRTEEKSLAWMHQSCLRFTLHILSNRFGRRGLWPQARPWISSKWLKMAAREQKLTSRFCDQKFMVPRLMDAVFICICMSVLVCVFVCMCTCICICVLRRRVFRGLSLSSLMSWGQVGISIMLTLDGGQAGISIMLTLGDVAAALCQH